MHFLKDKNHHLRMKKNLQTGDSQQVMIWGQAGGWYICDRGCDLQKISLHISINSVLANDENIIHKETNFTVCLNFD